jgi:hypothetical protein
MTRNFQFSLHINDTSDTNVIASELRRLADIIEAEGKVSKGQLGVGFSRLTYVNGIEKGYMTQR